MSSTDIHYQTDLIATSPQFTEIGSPVKELCNLLNQRCSLHHGTFASLTTKQSKSSQSNFAWHDESSASDQDEQQLPQYTDNFELPPLEYKDTSVIDKIDVASIKPLKAVYYSNSFDKTSDISLAKLPNPAAPYLYLFFHVGKIPSILSSYSTYEIY